MFYYLLTHSTLLKKQNEKARYLSILLCGSIIYIVIHAYLSFNKSNIATTIKQYFWIIFILDMVMSYHSIKSIEDNDDLNKNKSDTTSHDTIKEEKSFINEIFSLKDKITSFINGNEKKELINEKNEIILLLKEQMQNGTTEPSIKEEPKEEPKEETEETITSNTQQPIQQQPIQQQPIQQQPIQQQPIQHNDIETHNLSTSIKKIKNQIKNQIQPTEQPTENYLNDSGSESGSDMDFDISEFQTSLEE
jgi:hypothetical protein